MSEFTKVKIDNLSGFDEVVHVNAFIDDGYPFLGFTYDFAADGHDALRNVQTDPVKLAKAVEIEKAANSLDLLAKILSHVAIKYSERA